MKEAIVVGCGLSGSVIARYLAEELQYHVTIYERRSHIGGNMYDYVNDAGILVHKYGPHTFHTKNSELYEYMCSFSEWEEYKLTCGAVINGKYTPTPFNFQTIDDFFDKEKAKKIKEAIKECYGDKEFATVLELLNHENTYIREYAKFLFDNDYSLYTAKQWGISPSEIDPSVLKRVPIRFSYDIGYFDDKYQVMPKKSYTSFFENLLDSNNIEVRLNEDICNHIKIDEKEGKIAIDGVDWKGPLVYSGAIDELFNHKYGKLPYRSLKFDWKTENSKSFQEAPVVAYPQAEGFTRITEYTKLPYQNVGNKTSYAIEYSIPYEEGRESEPYYPIPNESNFALYQKYRNMAEKFNNLFLCGRLAEYKYFNMDQALENALKVCELLKNTDFS